MSGIDDVEEITISQIINQIVISADCLIVAVTQVGSAVTVQI
jgi:hypothetical protein